MNTINLKLYDTLRKELNLSEEKSRAITQAIEEVVEVDKIEVATKDFVKKEISEAKNELIKWVVGVFLALALMIIGLYIKMITPLNIPISLLITNPIDNSIKIITH